MAIQSEMECPEKLQLKFITGFFLSKALQVSVYKIIAGYAGSKTGTVRHQKTSTECRGEYIPESGKRMEISRPVFIGHAILESLLGQLFCITDGSEVHKG